jgi:hypothetical protein
MLSLGLSICSPAVWANGAFVPSNEETATLIAAMTGSYSKALKQAWDDAIGALKTSGAWTDFDILYPIGAIPGTSSENAADSRLNWKNPAAYTLLAVNSPTHGNGYWQGDGSSARLRTQYTPSSNAVEYLQDDMSLWFWSLTDSAVTAGDCGNSNVFPLARLITRNASDQAQLYTNDESALFRVSMTDSLGLYAIQRRAVDDKRLWKNGSQFDVTYTTHASTGLPTQEFWVCGANSNGFSSKRCAMFAAGASQATREASTYTTIQTLFTAAGTI